jgi:autotransporter translocation and assembly factor TamB
MFLWLLLAVFLAILGASVLVSTPQFRQQLKSYLLDLLSENLGHEVALGKVRLSLPGTLQAEDLRIALWKKLDEGTLFEAKRITVRTNLWNLVRRKFIFQSVEVVEPKVWLAQDSTGRWNYADLFKPQKKKKKEEPPVAVTIARIVVVNGTFQVSQPKSEEHIENISLAGSFRLANKTMFASLTSFQAKDFKRDIEIEKFAGDVMANGDSVRMIDLFLKTKGSELHADGGARFEPLSIHAKVDKGEIDLGEVNRAIGIKSLGLGGKAKVSGQVEGPPDSLEGQGKLELVRAEAFGYGFESFRAGFALHDKGVGLAPFSGVFASAGVEGSGRFSWKEKVPQYELNVAVQHFDLRKLFKTLPKNMESDLNGKVAFKGEALSAKDFKAKLVLTLENSRVGQFPCDRLEARMQIANLTAQIDSLGLTSQGSTLSAVGEASDKVLYIDLATNEVDISKFGPIFGIQGLTGKLHAKGVVQGKPQDPGLIGSFYLKNGSYQGMGFASLEANLKAENFVSGFNGDGSLEILEADAFGMKIQRATLKARSQEGKQIRMTLDVLKDSTTSLEAGGLLRILPDTLAFTLDGLYLTLGDQQFLTSEPLEVALVKNTVLLKDFGVLFGRGRVRANGQVSFGGEMAGGVFVKDIDLAEFGTAFKFDHVLRGVANLTIQVKGTFAAPEFTLAGKVRNGVFDQFAMERIDLHLDYKGRLLTLNKVTMSHGGELSEISGTFPIDLGFVEVKNRFPDAPMHIEALFRDTGSWVLWGLSDLLSVTEGRVDVNVEAKGTFYKPDLHGEMTLHRGTILLRPFGTWIKSVEGYVTFEQDRLVIQKVSGITGKQGSLLVTGFLNLPKLQPTTMAINVTAKETPVKNIEYMEGVVNANIVIGGQVARPSIRGEVEVVSGKSWLPFGMQLEEEAPSNEVPLDVDLMINGERNIWLTNEEANLELKIVNLNVRMEGAVLFLAGTIDVIQGTYSYLDKDFKITEGRVRFLNDSKMDPLIDIKAETEIIGDTPQKTTTIYLHLTGRSTQLTKPELSSKPSASEQDILLMLNLNMTWDEVQQARQGLLASAAKQQLLGTGEKVASRYVQKYLGLSMFRVRTSLGAPGKPATTRLTAGKYLTKELFTSYSQDLLGKTGTDLRAEYRLNRVASLYGERDEDSRYNVGVKWRWRY